MLSKHLLNFKIYHLLLQKPSPIVFSRVVMDVCKNRMGSQLLFSTWQVYHYSSLFIIKDEEFILSLSRQSPTLSFPFTYAFSAQLCDNSPLAAPCLHDAQQLTSFLLHTHCSSNYSWVVEEWNEEQKFLISWSVLWNWKIHTKYLLSHRRILCRLMELHIICEMNLGSWREGFKCPLKNTDVPPARLGITGFFIGR